jgi:cell division transport system permease protein
MFAGLKYFASEAAVSLWRGRRSSALSILTIAVALFTLGLFLLISENLERTVAEWGRAAEFSVYLRDDVSLADRDAIERALRAHAGITGVESVSKEQAIARFRADFPDLAPATAGAPENPFPASFEARLASSSVDAGSLERMAKRLAGMSGVADVRYDRRWLDRLASISRFVRWVGLALSAILMLAAGLTVANVVRLALFARRDEIDIMELVGAPIAFIRGPFVFEGVIQGGLGALLALALLWVGVAVARPRIADAAAGLVDAGRIAFLSAGTVLVMMAGGMIVGCLGGLVASRRLR